MKTLQNAARAAHRVNQLHYKKCSCCVLTSRLTVVVVQIFREQNPKAAISALSIGARVVQGNELAPFDNEGFQDVEGLLERTIV
jgi:hypothetical protein